MPYQPKLGGTVYRRKLANLSSHNRKIRTIITEILEKGNNREQLYLYLNAITLITVSIDDVVTDLADFDDTQEST